MKKLLFGWLLKPHYKITGLDSIIMSIELMLLFIIVISIFNWLEDRRNK